MFQLKQHESITSFRWIKGVGPLKEKGVGEGNGERGKKEKGGKGNGEEGEGRGGRAGEEESGGEREGKGKKREKGRGREVFSSVGSKILGTALEC